MDLKLHTKHENKVNCKSSLKLNHVETDIITFII